MTGAKRLSKSLVLGGVLYSLTAFGAFAADAAAVTAVKSGASCPGCDLTGANLPTLQGFRRDFSFIDLSGGDLYRAVLPEANFAGAILTDVNLDRANLSNAEFQGAMLQGASLVGANLSGASLGGAMTDELTLTDESTTCPDGTAGPCQF